MYVWFERVQLTRGLTGRDDARVDCLTSTQIHQPPTKHQWLGVAIYNPLLVLLALFCFPLDFIAEKQNSIIAHMAQEVRACMSWVCGSVGVGQEG